jgi:hypothetical protein
VLRGEQEAETYCGSTGKYLSLESSIRKYLKRAGSGTVSIGLESPNDRIKSGLYPELTARRLMAKAKAKKIIKDLPFLARTGLTVNISASRAEIFVRIKDLPYHRRLSLSLIVEETPLAAAITMAFTRREQAFSSCYHTNYLH